MSWRMNNEAYCSQSCHASCCRKVPHPPFDIDGGESLPSDQTLAEEVMAFFNDPQKISDDIPCQWLDPETFLCTHYEERPLVCRSSLFDPGGTGCEQSRKSCGHTPYDGPVFVPLGGA